MRSPIRTRVAAVVAALALVLAACGDDDDTGVAASGDAEPSTDSAEETVGDEPATGTDDEGTFPVTVTLDGTDTTIEERPESIVVLSPTGTEMLFAIGAGDQVIAVDDYSTYPPEAPTTELSAYEPNVEAIIARDPDLVVVSDDTNDVVDGLAAVGVPSIVLDAAQTLDDTYAQIEALGAATGHVGDAAELVGQMQTEIDSLIAEVPDRDEPLTYYHELDDSLYSVTSDTFIGQIYELAGLENIADATEGAAESGGYPQLSAEFVIDADPDLIFLADAQCCGQTAETVSSRPGWSDITAVQQGNIVELDEDIASRWGPRVVDFLAAVVEATSDVDAGVAG